jgi:FkbM family methyltransferase
VLKESFDDDIYLKIIPEYHPREHHTLIDVGAHIGCFSLFMATKLTKGRIYAFEPCKESFDLLAKNISDNDLRNVVPLPFAVSDNSGTAHLYYDLEGGNWGHSITNAFSTESESIQTLGLADFFEKECLQKVDLVKFNCEGAEFQIILGTPIEVLQRIEAMVVLYHEELVDGASYKLISNKLAQAGFTVRHRLRDKGSRSGRLIAYQAKGFQLIYLTIKALPLEVSLTFQEAIRKFRRLVSIVSGKG